MTFRLYSTILRDLIEMIGHLVAALQCRYLADGELPSPRGLVAHSGCRKVLESKDHECVCKVALSASIVEIESFKDQSPDKLQT